MNKGHLKREDKDDESIKKFNLLYM